VLLIEFIEFASNIGETYFLVDREAMHVWFQDRWWMLLIASYAFLFYTLCLTSSSDIADKPARRAASRQTTKF